MHNPFTSPEFASFRAGPCVVADPFFGIGTVDYFTVTNVRCSIASFDGATAVAMFVGNSREPLIFSEDFLIDIFNRCKSQLEVRQNPGLSLIGSNPVTLDPISGKRVEAGLVFIGDEVFFAISVDTYRKPIRVTPKFLGGILEMAFT